jgi:aspartokinase/homoserine dehydrogenase 1
MSANDWVVHKFGGTSVADAERYRHVAGLVTSLQAPKVGVVVSAMSKVTDALFTTVGLAARRDGSVSEALEKLRARHIDTVKALVPADTARELQLRIDDDVRDIADILRAVAVLRGHSATIDEIVSGYGEVWSAQILAAHLRSNGASAAWLDAREILVVTQGELGPVIEWEESKRRLDAYLEKTDADIIIITGYVATTKEGVPTTLKRNGSDFSASIFGALLNASSIVIWTDVDGVLSADPRRVPEAIVVDKLSYAEAMELAYFGAKVVHPQTMTPAVSRGIPIWIKNTFNPTARGTVIEHADRETPAARNDRDVVRGFTTIDNVALVNVEGSGMIGVPGIAERIFGALRNVGVSVVVISQASSEHSICFAVPELQADLAVTTLQKTFVAEIQQQAIHSVSAMKGCSVLAAVGEGMVQRPGVAARFFRALGAVGVNVRAIAQGSSERNISAVIDAKDSTRALRAVHAGFTLSDQTLSVGLVGPGSIGKTLFAQLAAQTAHLREHARIDLRVRGILHRERMLLVDDAIDPAQWQARFEKEAVPADMDAFARHIRAGHLPHAAIVDCTASDALAERYAGWLAQGIHVVTPNKKAGSGPLARYRAIRAASQSGAGRFYYEATVGAGLPVITTLKDLIHTGDRVLSIEGVLSGTLSYIFNTLTPGTRFSSMVREARRLGYTEPDPRDDLSGLDFARKLVVLAREMGRDIELSDVVVEDLAPRVPAGLPPEKLLEALAGVDEDIAKRMSSADAEGCVLRYVGRIPEDGLPKVELVKVPRTHPFANVSDTANVIAFRTARYDAQPLVVQGPGAGPEVTAGGVFADLLRLASSLS